MRICPRYLRHDIPFLGHEKLDIIGLKQVLGTI